MKILYKAFGVFLVLVAGCGQPDREKANQYYDDFSAVIVPYKKDSERILTETQSLLHKQLQRSGDTKLAQEDSAARRGLLSELETLARTTIDNINALDDLPESELKEAGIEYVETSTAAMLGAYRAIDSAIRNAQSPPDLVTIDSLTEEFSDDLVESNEKFAESQMKFMEEFDLLTN